MARPSPKPPRGAPGRSEADPRWNSSNIRACLGRRNAGPGIPDLDAHAVAAPAAGQLDAAVVGVTHGIGEEVLQNPAQHQRVRQYGDVADAKGEHQALCARQRLHIEGQRGEQLARRNRLLRRLHHAGLEPRDVEDRLQHLLDAVERVLDLIGDAAGFCRVAAIRQCRERQPRRVQGLQQIVADGGEKARLQAIGALGLVAGGDDLDVGAFEPGQRGFQLFGSQPDLRFEADRGLEQRVGVGLLIHRAFDALHQRRVDLRQLGDAPEVFRFLRGCSRTAAVSCHAHAAVSRRPKAMPVSVWFRCMALNCSP